MCPKHQTILFLKYVSYSSPQLQIYNILKISPPVHVPEDVKRIPNFKCRKDYQQGKTFFIVQGIVFFTIVKSPKVD